MRNRLSHRDTPLGLKQSTWGLQGSSGEGIHTSNGADVDDVPLTTVWSILEDGENGLGHVDEASHIR